MPGVLLDSRAVLVLLSQDVVEAFGLGPMDKAVITLANDQKVEMVIARPLAQGRLRIGTSPVQAVPKPRRHVRYASATDAV